MAVPSSDSRVMLPPGWYVVPPPPLPVFHPVKMNPSRVGTVSGMVNVWDVSPVGP